MYPKEDTDVILNSYTNRTHLQTCYQEYLCAHEKDNLQDLMEKGDFPDIPLTLITHSSQFAIEESAIPGDRYYYTKITKIGIKTK